MANPKPPKNQFIKNISKYNKHSKIVLTDFLEIKFMNDATELFNLTSNDVSRFLYYLYRTAAYSMPLLNTDQWSELQIKT